MTITRTGPTALVIRIAIIAFAALMFGCAPKAQALTAMTAPTASAAPLTP